MGRDTEIIPIGLLADRFAAIVDIAFLVVITGLAWREILAKRNWRNALICLVVGLFAVANGLFWFPETRAIGWHLALGVSALLITLVGGRIIPSFTRNWLAKRSAPVMPAPFGVYDNVQECRYHLPFVSRGRPLVEDIVAAFRSYGA